MKAKAGHGIAAELEAAGSREGVSDRGDKKNYAERLSRLLATRVANGLRPTFPGILPDEGGKRQESRARTSKGFKKLDVNYSTPELGLGLGVSIKTVNFVDRGSQRYTKNYTRIDGELRAEAEDYHERQPYAVLIAVIFIPADACTDGKKENPSSFAMAVKVFRHRSSRMSPKDNATLMEGAFIGLYEAAGDRVGDVSFFDVASNPPKQGMPKTTLTFDQLFQEITKIYDRRNKPAFNFEA